MYKNLIFDVGGVLLSYRWEYAMAEAGLTIERATKLFHKMMADPLWAQLDLAIRPFDEVVEDFCRMFPEEAGPIRHFFSHPENMPIDRPAVWEEIRRLKDKGYRIYLLSNYAEGLFRVHTEGKPFREYTDGELVSYMVHLIKPDPAFYLELLSRFGLDPKESLFFDDREENTAAARDCGIDSVTVESEEMLIGELKKL
ncbi:MAG: HAD family phosphatase [Lachnospiraceae bacterium]|nr:HAD family phosphatase [Lachnospiraceae bacterium]